MRRITLWLLSTVSALVLLLSYHTSLPGRAGTVAVAGVSPGPRSSLPGSTPSGTSSGAPSSSSAATSSGGSTPSARTVTGEPVDTVYGPVQVQISVRGRDIVDVAMLQVPWSPGRDQEVNRRAVPVLVEETTSSDSANIDMVSGATYTSQAYVRSLQSALDQL